MHYASKMSRTNFRPAKGWQSFALLVQTQQKSCIDPCYLGCAGGASRWMESTTRHHLFFSPPYHPTPQAQSAEADFLLPVQSKEMLLTLSICGSNSLCSLYEEKLLFQTQTRACVLVLTVNFVESFPL